MAVRQIISAVCQVRASTPFPDKLDSAGRFRPHFACPFATGITDRRGGLSDLTGHERRQSEWADYLRGRSGTSALLGSSTGNHVGMGDPPEVRQLQPLNSLGGWGEFRESEGGLPPRPPRRMSPECAKPTPDSDSCPASGRTHGERHWGLHAAMGGRRSSNQEARRSCQSVERGSRRPGCLVAAT